MTNRRVAFVLAATLGIVALALVAGIAVLELSPRDYRLAWLLRRTKRIEVSTPWGLFRVIEINDPDDVAAIVSAMTAKLDRLPQARLTRLTQQIHFILDDGRDIVAAVDPNQVNDKGRRTTSFVRLPGEHVLHAYESSNALFMELVNFEPIAGEPPKNTIRLGHIQVDGTEVEVGFDCSWQYHHGYYLQGEVDFVWPVGQPVPKTLGNVALDELIKADGSRVPISGWGGGGSTGNGFVSAGSALQLPLHEIDAIKVRLSGPSSMTFKVPPVRYHDVVVPPCPTCGAETSVMAWLYEWHGPAPSPGKMKIDQTGASAADEGLAGFFCESCQKSF